MKTKMLIALFAAVAFVGTTTGCGDEKKADDKKEAKDDKDKKDDKKDEKDGDTKEAKSDGDMPAVCQEYMDLWKKCEDKLPDASKDAMKQGYDAFKKSLDAAKGNADAMKAMETSCKAGVDGLKPVCN